MVDVANPHSIWDEDIDYPVSDWRSEVINDNTRLGYWDWVENQREQSEFEKELEGDDTDD